MATPKVIRLARLPIGWRDQPELLERYWDESMSTIESTLNAIRAIPIIQEALVDIDGKVAEAKAAAEAAQTAADSAGASSETQAKEASLVNSYVSNYTGGILVANSSGVVSVAAHDRVYGDSGLDPTVRVNSGSLSTAATPGSVVRVFYADAMRTGGTVSYQFTIDPSPPPVQGKDTHSVGAVVIPDAATGTQTGKGLRAPGYVEP